MLTIVTVTKDDYNGLVNTVRSTGDLREYHNVKQIIIDSSTKDKDAIREFICRQKNVDYFWQKPSGISAAFNLGLDHVQTEWVWFLNSRDEISPDIDPEKILFILRKTSADAVIFAVELASSGVQLQHLPMWNMWPPTSSWIPHPATITRKKLYQNYGNFDESYKIAMDYEFWLRCFAHYVIVDTISIPIVKFDESGVSSVQSDLILHETRRAKKSFYCKSLRMWIFERLGLLKKRCVIILKSIGVTR
jgi:glycosyltransferase involved in cell wall biosynthesis